MCAWNKPHQAITVASQTGSEGPFIEYGAPASWTPDQDSGMGILIHGA